MLNPDQYAEAATKLAKAGLLSDAFNRTAHHIRSKAYWVLVNGTWTPRKGVLRTE